VFVTTIIEALCITYNTLNQNQISAPPQKTKHLKTNRNGSPMKPYKENHAAPIPPPVPLYYSPHIRSQYSMDLRSSAKSLTNNLLKIQFKFNFQYK